MKWETKIDLVMIIYKGSQGSHFEYLGLCSIKIESLGKNLYLINNGLSWLSDIQSIHKSKF